MLNLLVGLFLLVFGIVATVTSPNTIYYGAMVVGAINIIRGLVRVAERQRSANPHASAWGDDH
jgi:hypothetical protein